MRKTRKEGIVSICKSIRIIELILQHGDGGTVILNDSYKEITVSYFQEQVTEEMQVAQSIKLKNI